MTTAADVPSFTLPERALLRQEFFVRFGQAPLLAHGIRLRRWRTGSKAGQPKLPPAVASMIARGLVTLQSDRVGASAQFTEAGYVALRTLVQDRRALNPVTYAHLRQEFGLAPVPVEDPQHPQGRG